MKLLNKFFNKSGKKEKTTLPEKPRRKHHRKKIILGTAGTLMILVVIGFVLFQKFGSNTALAGQKSSIQNATVANGNVSTTIEGTGSLANSSSDSIYVPTGIEIVEVYVSAGDKVTAGETLASVEPVSLNAELYTAKETLEDLADQIDDADSSTAEYYTLLLEQKNIQEKYEILTTIAQSNTIVADADGVITSVNVTAGEATSVSSDSSSSDSSSDSAGASVMSNSTASNQFMTLLSTGSSIEESAAAGSTAVETTAQISSNNTVSSIDLNITPAIGSTPVTEVSGKTYNGTITWNPSEGSFKENTAYTADVTLTPNEGYSFSNTTKITITDAANSEYALHENGNLILTATFHKLTTDTSSNINNNSNNNTTNDTSNNTRANNSVIAGNASTGAGMSAITSSGSGATGSDTTSNASSSSSDNSKLAAAFDISGGETMSLIVSVDELDILSVEKGQNAIVTLDAIEGEEFEGTITNVNTNGSSSNGVTKYEVEVTVTKTDNMLTGMNASVSIVIQESDNTLYIPAAALQQQGNSTFVYTKYDESSKELSGKVEIEIGNADGTNVEIVSGLSEDDTVYYEVVSSSDSEMNMNGMPSRENMPDGMEMPSGGQMPSGGRMQGGGGGN